MINMINICRKDPKGQKRPKWAANDKEACKVFRSTTSTFVKRPARAQKDQPRPLRVTEESLNYSY
jgi:hypothetical protein